MADSNPTPGEIMIMAGGAVALSRRSSTSTSRTPSRSATQTFGGGSANVWSFGLFLVASLMVVFAVACAMPRRHDALREGQAAAASASDLRWEQIYLILGFVATGYALAYLARRQGSVSTSASASGAC